jgi:thiol-disulfide isomerase/thioredoxin
MIKQTIVFLLFALVAVKSKAQVISGTLSQLPKQEIKLEGFVGLKTYNIAATRTDAQGRFSIPYGAADYGVGYLMGPDNKPLFVMLSGEDVVLKGESLARNETLAIQSGAENKWFEQYALQHPRREQALSAWQYLESLYQSDSLFSVHKGPSKAILDEKRRIRQEDSLFLTSLPANSYVRWFLPVRKLVSSVSVLAQSRPAEIPEAIAAFRALNYADPRLYKSGLFKDAIDNHFWLIENSGKGLDQVFEDMKKSIDAMMVSLLRDETKLNEVTDHLFDLLERHSLFRASEYLALKVLNEKSCTIEQNLARQLETYRVMKKGNTAPDLTFPPTTIWPEHVKASPPKALSDLKSNYTLVAFGSSNCPKCREDIPQISALYPKWKAQGVEVVFVSLDTDTQEFSKFATSFPFLSTCDFKGWKSPLVESYYVFGTPTLFLLDKKREILLRPLSVKQVDAWVDWVLIQGNK